MSTLAKAISKHKLSKLCLIGTWIIALIGVIHIISLSYYSWQLYLQAHVGTSGGPQVYNLQSLIILNYLLPILTSMALYFFCCIVLYAASVLFAALGTQAEPKMATDEADERMYEDEHIVYTSLKPREILRSKGPQ